MLYNMIMNEPIFFKTVHYIAKATQRNSRIIEHIKQLPKYRPNPLFPTPFMKLGLCFRPDPKVEDTYSSEEFTYKNKTKTRLDYYPKGKEFAKHSTAPLVVIIPGFSSTSRDRYIADNCKILWEEGGARSVVINNSTFLKYEIDENYDQNWFQLSTVDDVCEFLREKEETKQAHFYLLGISAGADFVHFYTGYVCEQKLKTEIQGSIAVSGSFDIYESINKVDRDSPLVSRVIIRNYKGEMRPLYNNAHFENYIKRFGLTTGKIST